MSSLYKLQVKTSSSFLSVVKSLGSIKCVVYHLQRYRQERASACVNVSKYVSFQSGGAILGPPGAPGAPVSRIIVLPEANPLQCAEEEN